MKAFRREIDRRLDYASHIKHEPRLCSDDAAQRTSHDLNNKYSDRMLAVDQCADLSSIIARYESSNSSSPEHLLNVQVWSRLFETCGIKSEIISDRMFVRTTGWS